VEERENYLKKKEFLIYSDTRFYTPANGISWNFMKQLNKRYLNISAKKQNK